MMKVSHLCDFLNRGYYSSWSFVFTIKIRTYHSDILVGESLMKIGEGLKSLATIHHAMLVNIVEKFIQPATEFKKDVKDSEQSHKKYDKKRIEFDAQVDLVNNLKNKGDKADPQKIQTEEEKQTQLDNEKDEAFEEALEETCDVLVKRQTKHLAQLNELLMSFHHFFAEGYTLTHDLKEPLEKLLEKSNKKASTFKQETLENITGGTSKPSPSVSSPPVQSTPVSVKPPTTATTGSTAPPMGSVMSGKNDTKSSGSNKTIAKCKALYSYDAQEDAEISFKEGDTILVYQKEGDEGWWKGAREATPNKAGLFPSNFVVDASAAASGKTTNALYDVSIISFWMV